MGACIRESARRAFQFVVVVVAICAATYGVCTASTQRIILVDLSGSVASVFPDYKLEIRKILERLDAGDGVVVVGITDDSFDNPRVLLNDEIAKRRDNPDPGARNCSDKVSPIDQKLCKSRELEWEDRLEKKVKTEREKVLNKWNEEADRVLPCWPATDILGAMKYVERLLEGQQGEKSLLIFSDMRHNTRGINLSSPKKVDLQELQKVRKKELVPRLNGVTVEVYGVHARQKTPAYLDSLEDFWRRLFEESGARLSVFKIHVPQLSVKKPCY